MININATDNSSINSQTDSTWPLKPVQLQILAIEQPPTEVLLTRVDPERLLIDAQDDHTAISHYLQIRCQKATTRNAVLRDLRKFVVFLQRQHLTRLRDVKAEDCLAFQHWLMHPEPALCCGQKQRPPRIMIEKNGRRLPNPKWRPFRGPLSPTSTNQTVDKIKALYAWLVDAGYLIGSPWKLIKPVTRATTTTKDEVVSEDEDKRELPSSCIKAVIHYLDHGAGFGQVEPRRFATWRWVFHFYLYTAARLTSGCTATLDDIYCNRKGHEQLTLTVKGAGIRRKDVPWIPELETEYHRYREALGLPTIEIKKGSRRRQPTDPLPCDQGPRHLLLALTTTARTPYSAALSYATVHGHVVDLFRTAHEWAVESPALKLEDWELAILTDATGHWIRHGAATLLGQHAQAQLGHKTIQQTQAYQANAVEQHRQQLRTLASTKTPTQSDVESLEELMEKLKQIMDRIKQIDPAALSTLLKSHMTDI